MRLFQLDMKEGDILEIFVDQGGGTGNSFSLELKETILGIPYLTPVESTVENARVIGRMDIRAQ